jgi:hypothetical protein
MVARALEVDGYQVVAARSVSELAHTEPRWRPVLIMLDVTAWPDHVAAVRWAECHLPTVPQIMLVPGGTRLLIDRDPLTATLSTPFDFDSLRRAIVRLRSQRR